jgi:hypothetical protein
MDRTHVLENENSIHVEKLLIISAVEAITIDADRILFPQLEAHARRSGRDTAGSPGNMEELEGPTCYLFPGPMHTPFRKLGVSISSPSLCHCE